MAQRVARARLTEWAASGHHRAMPAVNSSNAASGSRSTRTDFRTGGREAAGPSAWLIVALRRRALATAAASRPKLRSTSSQTPSR